MDRQSRISGSSEDAHYTPSEVADRLIDFGELPTRGLRVADFAAGRGALLQAFESSRRDCRVYASDRSAEAVRHLRTKHPGWTVGRVDFLSPRSRAQSPVTDSRAWYDLVLLNPPFSYRGGRFHDAMAGTERLTGSPAACFVATASNYSDHILAVLPKSTFVSTRDQAIWSLLKRSWRIELGAELGRTTFEKRHATTVLVSLKLDPRLRPTPILGQSDTSPGIGFQLVRGCTPMHRLTADLSGVHVAHTTGLRNHNFPRMSGAAPSAGRRVSGACVLLPRVGLPDPKKIIAHFAREPLLLSDCVFAIPCETIEQAELVAKNLRANWSTLKFAWAGSCAPYTTVDRLSSAIDQTKIFVSQKSYVPVDPRPVVPRPDSFSSSTTTISTGGAG